MKDNQGNNSAKIKITSVSTTQFCALVHEPGTEDGPHVSAGAYYVAIPKGTYRLPDGTKVEAGTVDIIGTVNDDQTSDVWTTIGFNHAYTQPPVVVAQLQTRNNELPDGVHVNSGGRGNTNDAISIPWVTGTVSNVTASNADVALEKSHIVETGLSLSQVETLGYFVIESNKIGSFDATDGGSNPVRFQTMITGNVFRGFGSNGSGGNCQTVSLDNIMPQNGYIFIASKTVNNPTYGGWFRRCASSNRLVGLTIDSKRARGSVRKNNGQNRWERSNGPDYGVYDRNHPPTSGSIAAFSRPFYFSRLVNESDLRIDANVDPYTVFKGGTFSIDVNITNHGPDIASNVTMNFALPADVNFTGIITGASDWSCTQNLTDLQCFYLAGDFNVTQSEILEVTLTAPEITGVYTNYLSAVSDSIDDDGALGTVNFEVIDITSALLADYRFDTCELSGTSGDVSDSGPSGLDATSGGGLYTQDSNSSGGGLCQSSHFDGFDDIVTRTHDNDLNADSNSYTIMAWAKTQENKTAIVAAKGDYDGHTIGQDKWNGWYTQFRFTDNTSITLTWDSGVPNFDEWYHIAGTFDGSSVNLYVNGVKVKSAAANGKNIRNNTRPFEIGANGTQKFFNGNIDEVKLFKVGITEPGILALYTNERSGKSFEGSPRNCSSCYVDPVAEYRFDECSLDGSSGDIEDATGSGYDATSQNSAEVLGDGVLNNSIVLTQNRYAELENASRIDLSNPYAVSTWIKFPLDRSSHGRYFILGAMQGGGDLLVFDKSGSTFRWGIWDGSGISSVNLTEPSDGWHHVVVVNTPVQTKLYIDAVFVSSVARRANGLLRWIGTSGDDVNGQTIGTQIDEFKVFDRMIYPDQITKIYTNEYNGKNYDGSDREAISCQATPVAEYRMDACDVTDANWTRDSSGNGYTATYTGEKLSLQEGKICAGVEILRDTSISEVNAFKSGIDSSALGDVGTIMFWYRSNQKWDASPGKMLVDSTKGDKYFFLGLQSDGQLQYYLEDQNDGDFQSYTNQHFSYAAGEWVHLSMSWDFPSKSFKVFVNGQDQSLQVTNNSAGGVGRHIPSGLNELFIGDISFNYTQNSSVYDGLRSSADGRFDEVKLYDVILDQPEIDTIFSRESLLHNYDDNLERVCQSCLFEPLYRGFFDIWDSFRDIDDRNISTKIVSQNFQLTLASLNETQDALQEFNGTVCTQVVDTLRGYAPMSLWHKAVFADDNTSLIDFNVTHALQDARINIVWKRDVDEACPLVDEDNTTFSSDNFALRPEGFTCNVALSPLTAEHNYSATFVATQFNSASAAADYNTSDVLITSKKYMNNGEGNSSLAGTLTLDTIGTFVNGSSSGTLGFDDVGIVGIDLNDSSWANVDSDDTSAALRQIHYECNRTFRADHFELAFHSPYMENNTSFTYLSNDLNMSAWVRDLSLTATAKGALGKTLLNYQEPQTHYFAKSVDLNPLLIIPDAPYGDTANTAALPQTQNDINLSFSQGVADINYSDVRFNYPRSFDDPKNPFMINGADGNFSVDINEHDVMAISGSGFVALSQDATFCYGRLHPKDIKATDDPAATSIDIEVFDDSGSIYVSGFKQNSLNWFRHEAHNTQESGDVLSIHPRLGTILESADIAGFAPSSISIADPLAGLVDVSIPKHQGRFYLQVKTQPWLWYAPNGFGSDYDDNVDTSCLQHPCLIYTGQDAPSGEDVSSGTFKGSDFSESDRGDYTRKGLKVFR